MLEDGHKSVAYRRPILCKCGPPLSPPLVPTSTLPSIILLTPISFLSYPPPIPQHPVTEAITGTDLVEWQLRVASGQPLPLTQAQIDSRIQGCAIEARIYAENPLKDFLPGSGYLAHLQTPSGEGVRVDSGVIVGNTVSTFYDPMIAKLVVFAEDRAKALVKLEAALKGYQVAGLTNNIDFLVQIIRHPAFTSKPITTAFFQENMDEILASLKPIQLTTVPKHVQVGCVAYLQSLSQHQPGDEFGFFRTTKTSVKRTLKLSDATDALELVVGMQNAFTCALSPVNPAQNVLAEEKTVQVISCVQVSDRQSDRNVRTQVMDVKVMIDTLQVHGTVSVVTHTDGNVVVDVWLAAQTGSNPTHYHFAIQNAAQGSVAGGSANPLVTAPMPGKVVKVLVQDGQEVVAGQPIVIMEAMKMEHVVNAPTTG